MGRLTHWGTPAYNGPRNRKIRKLADRNPKRGASALRFAEYRTGMTVRQYVEACDKLGIPNYALFDLTWDSDPKRKFIELYD